MRIESNISSLKCHHNATYRPLTFTAESVQGPGNSRSELALSGILQHRLKLPQGLCYRRSNPLPRRRGRSPSPAGHRLAQGQPPCSSGPWPLMSVLTQSHKHALRVRSVFIAVPCQMNVAIPSRLIPTGIFEVRPTRQWSHRKGLRQVQPVAYCCH